MAADSKPLTKGKKTDLDKQDDQNDRDLMDILKASSLIEQIQAQDQRGKERIRYQTQKLQTLGAKTKPQKVPLPIRIGMNKKKEIRTEKAIQEAKDTGMYAGSKKTELMGLKKGHRKKRKKDTGIYGSIGTIKDGVMKVSASQIAAVEKGSRKSKGRFKRAKF